MTEKQIAIYLKKRLNSVKTIDGLKVTANIYNVNSYPITECNNFDVLKEECRKLNFYIDYVCDSPYYRSDLKKKRNQVIVYFSRLNF